MFRKWSTWLFFHVSIMVLTFFLVSVMVFFMCFKNGPFDFFIFSSCFGCSTLPSRFLFSDREHFWTSLNLILFFIKLSLSTSKAAQWTTKQTIVREGIIKDFAVQPFLATAAKKSSFLFLYFHWHNDQAGEIWLNCYYLVDYTKKMNKLKQNEST